MDLNASDPFLIAARQTRSQPQRGASADVLELCRLFLLQAYLKHFGRVQTFDLLQREHESLRLNTRRSLVALLLVFLTTWFLRTGAYNLLAGAVGRFRRRRRRQSLGAD